MSDIKLYQGDCLEIMKQISDKSIDMILCDLPYGTTACKWDSVIPFDKLWEQYLRIIKDNGAVLLFGREPFSSYLRLSNINNYKYDWIWEKSKYSNFLNLQKQPAFNFENISVFYKLQPTYNPIMRPGTPYIDHGRKKSLNNQQNIGCKSYTPITNNGTRYPNSTIFFNNGNNNNVHPTQKPLELCKYLIKTYTNEGDLVLDNCMGSGTTGVACKLLNRNFIGIELDEKYFKVAKERIDNTIVPKRLF